MDRETLEMQIQKLKDVIRNHSGRQDTQSIYIVIEAEKTLGSFEEKLKALMQQEDGAAE